MWLDYLLKLISPHTCLGCNKEGGLLCTACKGRAVVKKRSTCFMCNKITNSYKACPACRRKTSVSGVVVVSHYEGLVKQLIQKLKYYRAQEGAQILAEILSPCLDGLKIDLVVSMPTAAKRYRQRGYNHAALIARKTAKLIAVPYFDSIRRLGYSRQVGTDRKLRLKQLQDTMYVTGGSVCEGKRALVIDDVLTTGASMHEAARALKTAGARTVWGAVIAKH